MTQMSKEPWGAVNERADEGCAGCRKPLAASGAPTFAALFPEGEGFRRRDYCVPCFEGLGEKPFSFWKRAAAAAGNGGAAGSAAGQKEQKKAARRRDLDALLELFERLGTPEGEKGPDAEKLRYLLALALVRKKRLHLVELARTGGADCLVIRASGEAELISVPAPALSKDELERLARDLETEVGLS